MACSGNSEGEDEAGHGHFKHYVYYESSTQYLG